MEISQKSAHQLWQRKRGGVLQVRHGRFHALLTIPPALMRNLWLQPGGENALQIDILKALHQAHLCDSD
jgi:hypothetical protein